MASDESVFRWIDFDSLIFEEFIWLKAWSQLYWVRSKSTRFCPSARGSKIDNHSKIDCFGWFETGLLLPKVLSSYLSSYLSFYLCFWGFEGLVVGGNLLSWNEEISCFWIVLCWIYLMICVELLLDCCMRMLRLVVFHGGRVNLNEGRFVRRDGWRDWRLEWVLMMMMGFEKDKGFRMEILESIDRWDSDSCSLWSLFSWCNWKELKTWFFSEFYII